MKSWGVLVAFLLCYCGNLISGIGLKEEFTWSKIDFAVPENTFHRPDYAGPPKSGLGKVEGAEESSPSTTAAASSTTAKSTEVSGNPNGEYVFENNVPQGANRWRNKLFITLPRRKLGIPSTLNYIPIDSVERHNVPLIPYPDLKSNRIRAPEGEEHIISVYRVAIDACDRIWMADTGIVETTGNKTKVGPQRIVIIDLNTDTIIKTYNFKDSDVVPATILSMTVVDVTPDKCDDAYAYFPDLSGFGLIVYSLKQDDSWRVNHNYFYVEPLAGEFNVGGIRFQWNDGIFSLALTDTKSDGFRDAIFHSMAGSHLYSVSTKVLRDKELATRGYHEEDFKSLGDRGPGSQTSATDLHKPTNVLFLSLVNRNAVGCWNIRKPLEGRNIGIVQKNDTAMIYPADLKIYNDDVIVLTNCMPIFVYSTLDYDQTNFRVWMNSVSDAVKGTVCEN